MSKTIDHDVRSLSPIVNNDLTYIKDNSFMVLLNPFKNFTIFQNKDFIINWVNSFESPFCLLASDAKDFKSGIVLCEVIHEIFFQNNNNQLSQQILRNDTIPMNGIKNFNLAIRTLKSVKFHFSQQLNGLTGSKLYQNEDLVFALLEKLFQNQETSKSTTIITQNSMNFKASEKKNPPSQNSFRNLGFVMQNPQLFMNSTDFNQGTSQSVILGMTQKQPFSTRSLKKPPLPFPKQQKTKSFFKQRPLPTLPRQNKEILVQDQEYQEKQTSFSDVPEPQIQLYPIQDEDEIINKEFLNYIDTSTNIHQRQSSAPQRKKKQRKTPKTNSLSPRSIRKKAMEKFKGSQELFQDSHKYMMLNKNNQQAKKKKKIKLREVQQLPVQLSDQFQESPFPTLPTDPNIYNLDQLSPRKDEQDIDNLIKISPKINLNKINSAHASPLYREKQSEGSARHQQTIKKLINDIDAIDKYITEAKRSNKALERSFHLEEQQEKKSRYLSAQRIERRKKKNPYTSQSFRRTYEKYEKKIEIDPVSRKVKKRILKWLQSICLIKDSIKGLNKKLHKICKNGVIFTDIINRIEGRNQTVIKGINRKAKKSSYINANYIKIMKYLRKIEKVNPRYLYAAKYLKQGNHDVFWGFLDDLWHYYHNKNSPFDRRYNKQEAFFVNRSVLSVFKPKKDKQKQNKTLRHSHKKSSDMKQTQYDKICYKTKNSFQSYKKTKFKKKIENIEDENMLSYLGLEPNQPPVKRQILLDQDEMPVSQNLKVEAQEMMNIPVNNRILQSQFKSSRKRDRATFEKIQNQHSMTYYGKHQIRSSFKQKHNQSMHSQRKTPQKSQNQSYSRTYKLNKSQISEEQKKKLSKQNDKIRITEQMEYEAEGFLLNLGFRTYIPLKNGPLFNDPFRNGILLCNVVSKIKKVPLGKIYRQPKSIGQCRFNLEKALNVLKENKSSEFPLVLLWKTNEILEGNDDIIWAIYYYIKKEFEKDQKPSVSPPEGLNNKRNLPFQRTNYDYFSTGSKVLPYSEADIQKLEISLMNWIIQLGMFNSYSYIPQCYEELTQIISKGVLLCDLVRRIIKKKIKSVSRNPQTKSSCVMNIRRALEVLRKKKRFGQKFTWKEKEIQKGDKMVILGLLEDLHLYFDKEPKRTDPNYFCQGPYFGDEYLLQEFGLVREKENINNNLNTQNNSGYVSTGTDDYYQRLKKQYSNSYSKSKQMNLLQEIKINQPISILKRNEATKHFDIMNTSNNYNFQRSSAMYSVESEQSNRNYKQDNIYLQKLHKLVQLNDFPDEELSLNMKTLQEQSHKNFQDLIIHKQVDKLRRWFKSIGFDNLAQGLNFNRPIINEFCDGLLLCRIIENLERKKIKGINQKPITKAACIVNIRKALAILKRKSAMKLNYIYREEQVQKAEQKVIIELLLNIKAAYRRELRKIDVSVKRMVERVSRFTPKYRDVSPELNQLGQKKPYILSLRQRKQMLVPLKYAKD